MCWVPSSEKLNTAGAVSSFTLSIEEEKNAGTDDPRQTKQSKTNQDEAADKLWGTHLCLLYCSGTYFSCLLFLLNLQNHYDKCENRLKCNWYTAVIYYSQGQWYRPRTPWESSVIIFHTLYSSINLQNYYEIVKIDQHLIIIYSS